MQLLLAESSLANLILSVTTWLLDLVGRKGGWEPDDVTLAILHTLLIGAVFGLPAGVFIWAERKVSGRIQDRLGPTRTGGRFGWLQSAADGLKLIQKEDLAPAAADKVLFRAAPYVVVVASFLAYMFLPFSDGWSAVGIDVGLFLLTGMLALEVIGVIFAGYSSGSKWALFGAIRESAQMVSYEIPMAICALVPIVLAGTLNLNEVVHLQVGSFAKFMETGFPPFLNWFVFHPVGIFAFTCYFVCATASCKRAPFDLAEAESELVAGFLTEYSGMRWSFFFLAEYASMFLVSGVAVSLFLGGWDDGFGVVKGLKDAAATEDGFKAIALQLASNLLGALIFTLKASKLVFIQIWVRWTLPRIRIDQVMTTCLKYLIPISCTLFLAATAYPLVLASSELKRPNLLWTEPMGDRAIKPRPAKAAPTAEAPAVDASTPAASDSSKGVTE